MSKLRFVLKNILFLFNLVFVLGLLISYLAPYVDPQDFWPVAFFGLTYKGWLLANVLLLILWLVLKRKIWAYNAIVIVVGIQFLLRDFQFNEAEEGEGNFKVMVFNTRVQQVYDGDNTSQQINDFLVGNDLDVGVLVEWLDKQGNIDIDAFPYQQMVALNTKSDRHRYGLKLVSKYKILRWERIEYPHFSNNVTAFFDLEVGEKIIRVIGTHLQSNNLVASDYSKFIEMDFDDEYKEHAKNVVSKMRSAMLRRAVQVERILEIVDESPYPVIILGDFNDTPQSFAYQRLKGSRKDAYVTNGSGIGATYLKPFPLLRIDFMLYDPIFDCKSFESSNEIESDHKLLVAEFKI
ncbi:endonuclease/exonuclease/phosphatase family protein [bacterium]|nr:endonuclease/exonuclease/phosphatase family protein [bacterium]